MKEYYPFVRTLGFFEDHVLGAHRRICGCQIYFVLWLLDFLPRANTGLFQTTDRTGKKHQDQNHKDEEL